MAKTTTAAADEQWPLAPAVCKICNRDFEHRQVAGRPGTLCPKCYAARKGEPQTHQISDRVSTTGSQYVMSPSGLTGIILTKNWANGEKLTVRMETNAVIHLGWSTSASPSSA